MYLYNLISYNIFHYIKEINIEHDKIISEII